jgi:hypothetical protein
MTSNYNTIRKHLEEKVLEPPKENEEYMSIEQRWLYLDRIKYWFHFSDNLSSLQQLEELKRDFPNMSMQSDMILIQPSI